LVIDLGQSWRAAYGVLVGVQIVLLLAFLLTIRRWQDTPSLATGSESKAVPHASIQATLRLTMMWLSLGLFFVYGGVEIGMGQLLNNLLVEGRVVDPRTAGFWVSLYWGSFTVGRMLIGVFIDRVGPRTLVRASFIGVVVGTLLIWWNPAIVVSFAGIALVGFALAPVFPTLLSVTPDRVGVEHTPNAIGFQIGFAGLGAALLVGLAGVLAENLGKEFISLFLVIVALAAFGLHEIILRREPS
jgi:fucose permease